MMILVPNIITYATRCRRAGESQHDQGGARGRKLGNAGENLPFSGGEPQSPDARRVQGAILRTQEAAPHS
jgi:hypothetical protein